MEAERVNKTDPKEVFNPVLFWDADEIDIERNASYIITRILDYGNEKDIKLLRGIYPDKKLIEVVRKSRVLMPQTGKFWAIYFNIPPMEIACLRAYYQKKPLE
mgnify:CR=1 FL=1